MQNTHLIKKLDSMVNKTWQYGSQIFYFISYKIDGDKVIIKTNIKDFDRPAEAVESFLSYWKEASTVQTLVPIPDEDALRLYQQEEKSQADKLIAILEDNITKVQNSKEYIPQATAINNNINSIINIQKMKMTFMKKSRH